MFRGLIHRPIAVVMVLIAVMVVGRNPKKRLPERYRMPLIIR